MVWIDPSAAKPAIPLAIANRRLPTACEAARRRSSGPRG